MSSTQLQQLMAQVEQLTLVNNKLQQELSSNSSHIARLETAMQQRRGITPRDEDAGAPWSQSSSARSSRSGEGGGPVPHPTSETILPPHADTQLQSPKVNRSYKLGDPSTTGMPIGVTRRDHSTAVSTDTGTTNTPPPTGVLRQHRPAANNWQHPEGRERRDSGSCDHTESELNGLVFRDVSTNTPAAHEVHFARLPELEDAACPGVKSSDRHGNELVTIGTQTTEVVMNTDCEHEAVVENVRGCSKAATPQQLSDFYHGAWPIVDGDVGSASGSVGQETQSVMSFHSSISSHSSRPSHHYKDLSNKETARTANQPSALASQSIAENHSTPIALQPLVASSQQLGSKVQMVYSLISMLGTHDSEDMSQTLLVMSSSPDSCVAMRQSGCLPLLVQLIYGSESDKDSMNVGRICRARACQALHNIIHSPPDDKKSRREVKLLKYLEIVQAYCQTIREDEPEDESMTSAAEKIWPPPDIDKNPGPAVAALMKLSFDDHCRQPIVALGGLQCMAQLIKFDQASYSASSDIQRITMRRYACMTLTNLTFGDSTNKARLCAMQSCLDAIVHQLQSFNEDLCQVAASVIRNLSWKADQASKRHLRLSCATTKLMITAIQVSKESTLKSILSALWNLSAHCTYNKTCICEVDGSIEFLVGMLSYQSPGKTLAIVECAGGILRNISSVIAVRDDYRKILRVHNALAILLSHLKSPSLAIVGNACGALWNISARCPEDQKALLDLQAVNLLKNLTASKHRLVSLGSAATIKNLMQFKNEGAKPRSKHSSSGKKGTTEPCETPLSASSKQSAIEPSQSPSKHRSSSSQLETNSSSTELTSKVQRADSQDSVGSCSSLTSREGLTTLTRIEQLVQDVMHTNMEMHQIKASLPTTSTHSSDTRLNHSGSSTPRAKPMTSLMTKSSDYSLPASHFTTNVSVGRQRTALSPRVSNKRSGHISGQGSSSGQYYPALVSSLGPPEDRFSVRSGGSSSEEPANRTNFSMTYNDDNIDNSSEKPVDYSQMYQESVAGYEQQSSTGPNIDVTSGFNSTLPRQPLEFTNSQLPAAFLPHDPAVLLQTSSGSFLDPSYFHAPIPTLEQIKAQAMVEKQRVTPAAVRPTTNGTRAMSDLSRIEDHHGEDQVRTFCTEGTPMNFLSTATSMNELNKIGEETIPEQDEPLSLTLSDTQTGSKVTPAPPSHTANSKGSEQRANTASVPKPSMVPRPKLPEEEDEPPRTYATEDTPVTGISRVSSLSSLTSGVDGRSVTGVSVEQHKEPQLSLPTQGALERIHEDEVLSPALTTSSSKPPPKTPVEQKTVSFDDHAHVQETPMMFSRASSLASLSSCDQHSIHSSVFSEYSYRRASQVVSPSDLPDSPGGTTPHSPSSKRRAKAMASNTQSAAAKQNTGRDALTPPLPHPDGTQANQQTSGQLNHTQYQPIMLPATSESQAISNLLGLSGMFGSLSGLASAQEPSTSINSATSNNNYGHIPANTQYANNSLHYPQPSYSADTAEAGYTYSHPHPVPPVAHSQYSTLPPHQMTQGSGIGQPLPSNNRIHGLTAPVHQGTDRASQLAVLPAHTAGKHQQVADTGHQVPQNSATNSATRVLGNTKVDQFLADTVRTYAVEGTPGPNSTRSSLSALTFLDEPDVPVSSISLLKASFNKSRDSVSSYSGASQAPPPALPAKRVGDGGQGQRSVQSPSKESPNKPLDLSMKPKGSTSMKVDRTAASTMVDVKAAADVEHAPPIPPKPAHLLKKMADSAAPEKSPSPSRSNSDKSPSSTRGANKPSTTSSRSSNNSESKNDSDSSSDGDDFMLQQCISSAMPISRKKMAKSSSDSAVTTSGTRAANRNIPRSKTFGSKLRIPSKKSLKAAQLAKQRQAPPIVSANSPTPDDDYFAEETVMAYCTEDTPYNKSTATSLSDLSVIDDDDDDLNYPPNMDLKEAREEETQLGVVNPPVLTKNIECEGAKASSSSSSDDDDDAANSMLDNAIYSALPKKSSKGGSGSVAGPSQKPPLNMVQTLKCTSNELRATDIKFQTSADSVRNYATEGTPNNFSTHTSLSDLTMDSHYSSSRIPSSQASQLKHTSAVKPSIGQSKQLAGQPTSKQSSLLPKRQGSGLPPQSPLSSLTSRIPQATSSPVQRVSATTPSRSIHATGTQLRNHVAAEPSTSTSDEIKSFGVEGTPFNYSRRESLSSLSCDDDDEEDDELNITIINRVNDAMMKRLQENKSQHSKIGSSKLSDKSTVKSEELATAGTSQRPAVEARDGVIKKFTLPPPSDGFQSRDEVTKSYTPIEGTPYCFSRNSPLSSLSGSDCESEEGGSNTATTATTIAEAHKAEVGSNSDSDTDSDASQGSLASSHAFLDQCISSALPKKTPSKNSARRSASSPNTSAQVNTSKQSRGFPPQTLPKPVNAVNRKPSPVSLLPATGEIVVGQRTPSRGMSTDTSTDSLKLDSAPINPSSNVSRASTSSTSTYKTTQEKKLLKDERELRRKTYTITESEIQSAMALIPSNPSLSLADTNSSHEVESNVDISGDEDDFDDVYMFKNGELFQEDINAVLEALRQASETVSDTIIDCPLPEPPAFFADVTTPPDTLNKIVHDYNAPVPPNHNVPRRPKITKPVNTTAVEAKDAEVKAIRGRRKLLYSSRKSAFPTTSNSSTPSRPRYGPSKPKAGVNSNGAGAIHSKPNSSKQSNISAAMKPTKSTTISKNQLSNGRASIPQNQVSKRSTRNPVKVEHASGGKTASSNKAVSTGRKNINQITDKLNKLNKVASVGEDSTALRSRSLPIDKRSKIDVPLVKADSSSRISNAGRNTDKGRVVSPSSVLHRAAVLRSTITAFKAKPKPTESATVDEQSSRGTSKLPTKDTSHHTIGAKSLSPLGSAASNLSQPTSRSTMRKPQAVSKIASLWKQPSSCSSSLQLKPSSQSSGNSRVKHARQSLVSAPKSAANKKSALKSVNCVPDYVVAISFREAASNSPREVECQNDKHTVEASRVLPPAGEQYLHTDGETGCVQLVKEVEVDKQAVRSERTTCLPSDADTHTTVQSNGETVKSNKNSAIVSPFLYKPAQNSAKSSTVSNDNADANEANTVFPNDGVSTECPSQICVNAESDIKVHLDIKPCITVLTDVNHRIEETSSSLPSIAAVDPHAPSYQPPMTKTEMLLRRRSEILHKRQINEYNTSTSSTSPHRLISKTTDV